MIFDNIFNKRKEQQALTEQRNEDTKNMILSQPNQQMDEARMLEKQEILIQLTQWQQSRSQEMQRLFEKLSAYHYDAQKKQLVKSEWERASCSLAGAALLVNFIEPLDRNVMLANWSDKILITTMRDAIAHPLRRYMRDNHNILGITIDNAEYVFWNIINAVEPTYWRGWNDGERRKDKEMIKINEVKNMNQDKRKSGLFGISG